MKSVEQTLSRRPRSAISKTLSSSVRFILFWYRVFLLRRARGAISRYFQSFLSLLFLRRQGLVRSSSPFFGLWVSLLRLSLVRLNICFRLV